MAANKRVKTMLDFDVLSTAGSGGKTGSAQVKGYNDNKTYQLKPSILDNTFKRKRKVAGADLENFGEFIAACIGRQLLSADVVPDVSLVYNEKRKRVLIVSEYITKTPQTLDAYAESNNITLPKKSHVQLIAGTDNDAGKGKMALDGPNMMTLDGPNMKTSLKQGLANAIVLSALVGDHDVNPGNMMVGNGLVARIDLGHAFNHLISAAKLFGGGIEDKENPVLDFFNREQIAGIGEAKKLGTGGVIPKLWRDYPGLVPSVEIVQALKQLGGKSGHIDAGIDEARSSFENLIAKMTANKDEGGIEHVKKSLLAIYENAGGDVSKQLKKSSVDAIFDEVFAKFAGFVAKNCANAQQVAELMEYQLAIDNSLMTGKPLSYTPKMWSIAQTATAGNLEWIKMDKDTPAFTGSFEGYLQHRAEVLKKNKEKDEQFFIGGNSLQLMSIPEPAPVDVTHIDYEEAPSKISYRVLSSDGDYLELDEVSSKPEEDFVDDIDWTFDINSINAPVKTPENAAPPSPAELFQAALDGFKTKLTDVNSTQLAVYKNGTVLSVKIQEITDVTKLAKGGFSEKELLALTKLLDCSLAVLNNPKDVNALTELLMSSEISTDHLGLLDLKSAAKTFSDSAYMAVNAEHQARITDYKSACNAFKEALNSLAASDTNNPKLIAQGKTILTQIQATAGLDGKQLEKMGVEPTVTISLIKYLTDATQLSSGATIEKSPEKIINAFKQYTDLYEGSNSTFSRLLSSCKNLVGGMIVSAGEKFKKDAWVAAGEKLIDQEHKLVAAVTDFKSRLQAMKKDAPKPAAEVKVEAKESPVIDIEWEKDAVRKKSVFAQPRSEEAIAELKEYQDAVERILTQGEVNLAILKNSSALMKAGDIEWLARDDTSAFKGDFNGYLQHRADVLITREPDKVEKDLIQRSCDSLMIDADFEFDELDELDEPDKSMVLAPMPPTSKPIVDVLVARKSAASDHLASVKDVNAKTQASSSLAPILPATSKPIADVLVDRKKAASDDWREIVRAFNKKFEPKNPLDPATTNRLAFANKEAAETFFKKSELGDCIGQVMSAATGSNKPVTTKDDNGKEHDCYIVRCAGKCYPGSAEQIAKDLSQEIQKQQPDPDNRSNMQETLMQILAIRDKEVALKQKEAPKVSEASAGPEVVKSVAHNIR
ncbi:MAG: hypothetical protein ACHP65_03220 [Legionellales bacterium]